MMMVMTVPTGMSQSASTELAQMRDASQQMLAETANAPENAASVKVPEPSSFTWHAVAHVSFQETYSLHTVSGIDSTNQPRRSTDVEDTTDLVPWQPDRQSR
jgi:hypothetical protein